MKYRIAILTLCLLVTFCGCHNNKKYADLPEELATLCKNIDKHPKNSELYYQRANYYYQHKDVDKGIADMQTAVKLQPDSSKYYVMLSDLYFAQVETDLAEEMLEKAIQKDPKNNEARLKLAELFYHENLLTQCNETLDEAIKQQKYNPRAYLIKAFMYKDMQDTTAYLRMLQLVIDQDPKEVKAYLELGYFYQKGLNPIAISYYQTRGAIMMVGGSAAQQALVEEFIRTNDIKQRQAYLELSIVELNEEGSKEFQNNWSLQSKNWGVTFNQGVTSGGRQGGPGDKWYPSMRAGWALQEDGTQKYWEALGKDKNIYGGGTYITWQMNYLIENKKGRMLANPKILITNGQQSNIDLTEDYVEKVTSEFLSTTASGAGASGAVQKTYTIGDDKGIKISLIPFISPDGYVTMNIKPEYSTEAGREYSTNEDGSKEVRDILDFAVTADERIADGFYFAKSIKILHYLCAHPEIAAKCPLPSACFDNFTGSEWAELLKLPGILNRLQVDLIEIVKATNTPVPKPPARKSPAKKKA